MKDKFVFYSKSSDKPAGKGSRNIPGKLQTLAFLAKFTQNPELKTFYY